MAYAVFTYGSGGAGSSPVAPLRATPPDRKAASVPSREDESFADAAQSRDRDARLEDAADAAVADRKETARRLAERAADRENEKRRAAGESADAAHRNTEDQRAAALKNEASQRNDEIRDGGNDRARNDAEAAETTPADVKAPAEPRREDIKRLEQIRAEALYPSPPSAKSREVAQRAHTELIRAEAELKAYELEKARQKAREAAIARFHADQAADAYRQLEAFDGVDRGLLH